MGFWSQPSNQWKNKSARVCHIMGNIEKVFKKPKRTKGESCRISLVPEVAADQKKDHQLA